MNILITGAAGYLGTVVATQLLSEGHTVRGLDNLRFGGGGFLALYPNSRFEPAIGDVRSEDDVKAAMQGVDAVVHLAAIVGDPACAEEPEVATEVNLDSTLLVFRAAQRAKVGRFVFMSTCSVYGKQPGDFVATEESSMNPQSLYAVTKIDAEKELVREARMGGSTAVTVLRLSTLFGLSPRMRFDLVVNKFTLLGQTSGKLTVYGPESWRPYLHVADAAGAISSVLSAPRNAVAHQVFNVGSENHQTKDIASFVRGYYNGVDVETLAGGPDPRDYRVSFDRLRAATGFEPSRTVLGGIHEMAMALGSGLLHRGPYVNNGFNTMVLQPAFV
ncbi:NAD-dependent epimerase/dehydratase family protein [Nonomuraea sp. NPDC050536]|uniref:NAD-dependent epimerase/dehydratase family protein n=1 Tax=Nonomuraea sp. NPDC050536 TaxID=3364366 RepID=UPI0037CC70C4